MHLAEVVQPEILYMLCIGAELHAFAVHVVTIHRDLAKAQCDLYCAAAQSVGFADLSRIEQYQTRLCDADNLRDVLHRNEVERVSMGLLGMYARSITALASAM